MNIGEVSRTTGLSERMIRHYEKLGLMSPAARTGGGYRDYSEADLATLSLIATAREVGLSFPEVTELVGMMKDDPGDAERKARISAVLDGKAASLARLRKMIAFRRP